MKHKDLPASGAKPLLCFDYARPSHLLQMPSEHSEFDIFISYSSKNQVIADAIQARLESLHFKCWRDSDSLVPGENWASAIARVIPTVKVMIFIVTRDSMSSLHVKREIRIASDSGVTIIPFNVDGIQLNDDFYKYYIADIQFYNVRDGNWANEIDSLVRLVKLNFASVRPKDEILHALEELKAADFKADSVSFDNSLGCELGAQSSETEFIKALPAGHRDSEMTTSNNLESYDASARVAKSCSHDPATIQADVESPRMLDSVDSESHRADVLLDLSTDTTDMTTSNMQPSALQADEQRGLVESSRPPNDDVESESEHDVASFGIGFFGLALACLVIVPVAFKVVSFAVKFNLLGYAGALVVATIALIFVAGFVSHDRE